MGTKKRPAKKSLSAGRPPSFQVPRSLSHRATKAVINGHHKLKKRKQQAVIEGDEEMVASLDEQIDALGGIAGYQQASLLGQRPDRGGDSSGVLMEWLKPVTPALKKSPLRMLEVGALSVDNACSRSGCFKVERIDLHSQGQGILQQDFMERPLPKGDKERFDIISLSLVLNYVPDCWERGKMLLRTLDFLHQPAPSAALDDDSQFPSLFVVLPAPCISNSRYIDPSTLLAMMESLGFAAVESKVTPRLVYYLWKRVTGRPFTIPSWPKREIRRGATRNNFSIVLTASEG